MAGGVALVPAGKSPALPHAVAAALHVEGLAAVARGDHETALERFGRALAADPTYVPALVDQMISAEYEPATQLLLRRIIADTTHPLRHCADAITTIRHGTGRVPLAVKDATACDRLQRLYIQYRLLSPDERVRLARAAFADFSESPYLLSVAVSEMSTAGYNEQAMAFIDSGAGRSELQWAFGEALAPVFLHRLGRHDEAIAREAEAMRRNVSAATRVLLRGVRANHSALYHSAMSPELRRHVDSARMEGLQVAAAWNQAPSLAQRFAQGLGWQRHLLDAGRLAEALSTAFMVQLVADSVGTALARAEAAMQCGRTAVKAGRYDLAERQLLSARAWAREGDEPRMEWEANHNLLHLYESTGRDSLALEAGLEFARIASNAPMRSERMMSYRDLGVHLRQRGNWEAAQRWFERMVGTVDSLRDGHSDFYAGEYLESVGQVERALTFYNSRARSVLPERSLAALARLSELLGDTAQALKYAEEHDDQGQKQYPEVRPLLPGVLARMGRWDDARDRLRVARQNAAAQDQRSAWGRLTTELAGVMLQMGQIAPAGVLADSAIAILTEPADREFAMQAVGIAAVAAAQSGQRDARRRITALAGARQHVMTTGGAALATDLAIMEGDAHRALGDRRAALGAYERGQKVVDSLASHIGDDATRTSVLASLRRVSSRALEIVVARPDEADAVRLWRRWSGYRKARTVDASLISPASEAPPTDRTVIDYVVLDSTIAALVAGPGGVVIRDLGVRPRTVGQLLDRLYATAAPRIGSVIDARRARLDQAATSKLYAALLEPLGDVMGWTSRVEIVPDGFLSLVPFDALAADDQRLVMERYVISLAPALRFAEGDDRHRRTGHALVVAGPARQAASPPGAPDELRRVQSAIQRRTVRALSAAAVTETSVREGMRGAAIVHLAAHARPNVAQPDFAEIWLGPDSLADGRLQAIEIRELDLDGAIVVLSACETGSGRVAGGEGPISIARAFVQAGASHVVATLWPVQASAGALMEAFHTRLDGGLDPASALREAKLALLRQGATPLDLAPFIIVASRR